MEGIGLGQGGWREQSKGGHRVGAGRLERTEQRREARWRKGGADGCRVCACVGEGGSGRRGWWLCLYLECVARGHSVLDGLVEVKVGDGRVGQPLLTPHQARAQHSTAQHSTPCHQLASLEGANSVSSDFSPSQLTNTHPHQSEQYTTAPQPTGPP